MEITVSSVVGPYVTLRFVICKLIYIYSATKPAAQLRQLIFCVDRRQNDKKSFKLMQKCTTGICQYYHRKRWNININKILNVLNLTKNIIFRKLNEYPSNKSTSIQASAFELTTDRRQVESNLSLTDGLVNETRASLKLHQNLDPVRQKHLQNHKSDAWSTNFHTNM